MSRDEQARTTLHLSLLTLCLGTATLVSGIVQEDDQVIVMALGFVVSSLAGVAEALVPRLHRSVRFAAAGLATVLIVASFFV
jgi:hypothetical protein